MNDWNEWEPRCLCFFCSMRLAGKRKVGVGEMQNAKCNVDEGWMPGVWMALVKGLCIRTHAFTIVYEIRFCKC